MSLKIEAVVISNDREVFVLNKRPVITYEPYKNFLIGLDEDATFCNAYVHQTPSRYAKAFAGREFDIPMTDGSVTKAKGQWWDPESGASVAEALGDEILSGISLSTLEDLKRCYVFTGNYSAIKGPLTKLREAYAGKVYGYWEYEAIIKGLKEPRRNDAVEETAK